MFKRRLSEESWLTISLFITILGLVLRTELPHLIELPQQITILIFLFFSIFGIAGALISFSRILKIRNEELRRVLNEYLPPRANSKLLSALDELRQYYLSLHEFGSIPVIENLTLKITLKMLDMEKAKEKGLVPQLNFAGISWLWFEFIIEEEWEISPEQRFVDYLDFILNMHILICDKGTYDTLISENLLPSKVMVFFPIPNVLTDEKFMTFLRNVKYITEASYTIRKVGGKKGRPYPSVKINLVPVNQNADQEFTKLFRLRSVPNSFRKKVQNIIGKGWIQLLQPKLKEIESNIEEIRISPNETDAKWHIVFKCKYILPGKVKEGERVLWDQKVYMIPFFIIIKNIQSIQFINGERDRIRFENRLYPLFAFIFAPQNVKLENDRWIVERVEYVFPGEMVLFRWEDSLIEQLS